MSIGTLNKDMTNQEIQAFTKGVHNLLRAEIIPQEAAQDALNWYTIDGVIKLINGRERIGQKGTLGKITGEIFGYKVNGERVHWRKAGTKIQYFNGTSWIDVVTGLTSNADYTFSNYSSLSGSYTYAFGVDGIYKFVNACPDNYVSMYDEAKNFKGHAFINKGRTILWGREKDKTGLYGSWIDNQREVSGTTGVYTSVVNEATTSLSGTLAFKSSNPKATCFNVKITLDGSGEVYLDDYLGNLKGSLGGTGTINYVTGAYTVSGAGAGKANYQWENSNVRGVTDFSRSATRLAGEGFQFPQDEGGDEIMKVEIGQDGAYYSMKKNSAYRLFIEINDTDATNEVYRKDMGIASKRSSVSMSKGIVFMNTSNQEKPELTILQKNPLGDNVEPVVITPHFKFSNYSYDDCAIDTYERYIVIACKEKNSLYNDVILLVDMAINTVDITKFEARMFSKDDNDLYVGSSLTEDVYKIFSGYDDEGNLIDNYYITKNENFTTTALKRVRKLVLKGRISPDQSYEVYVNYDRTGYTLIGTVRGDADYVNYTSGQSIGGNRIGNQQIGGNDVVDIYNYETELILRKPSKFEVRNLMFVAKGMGYVDIAYIMDKDILFYEQKLPSHYRIKQNVSIDGTQTNLPNPQ